MNFKGICFFAKDVTKNDIPHLIVIVSEVNSEQKVMFVPMSSIKFAETGKRKYKGKSCIYYDDACVLNGDEIKTDNDKNVLTKPSFIFYRYAQEVKADDVLLKQLSHIYEYRCKISDNLLKKIQDGAKKSEELPNMFKKYFEDF